MAINRIPRKLLEKKVAFFLKHSIPFKMMNTNERTVVHAEGRWGSWMNKESTFKPQYLQFIKAVKDHIVKNETWRGVRNNFQAAGSEKKIKYFYYNKSYGPGTYFEDIMEVDLKGAYWEQLYKLPGVITEEIYKKGLEVDKRTRLACVGTLAKTTEVINFDGKKETLGDPIKSTETEFLWNVISYKIGKLMAKAMRVAKKDFIFFWVDAIFIHGDSAKELVKLFKEAGFECSVHKCEWVRFDKTKIVVHSKEKGKYLTKRERTTVTLPNGKTGKKIKSQKVWTNERPFPFKEVLTEKDLVNLTAGPAV